MYIIEKIIRIYYKLTNKEDFYTLPQSENKNIKEDIIRCKHNFMPIDSTGNYLACSKCGYLVSRKRLNSTIKK